MLCWARSTFTSFANVYLRYGVVNDLTPSNFTSICASKIGTCKRKRCANPKVLRRRQLMYRASPTQVLFHTTSNRFCSGVCTHSLKLSLHTPTPRSLHRSSKLQQARLRRPMTRPLSPFCLRIWLRYQMFPFRCCRLRFSTIASKNWWNSIN